MPVSSGTTSAAWVAPVRYSLESRMIGEPIGSGSAGGRARKITPSWHLAARPTHPDGSWNTGGASAITSYPDVGVIRIIRRPWLSRADAVLHGVGTFWTRVARDNHRLSRKARMVSGAVYRPGVVLG